MLFELVFYAEIKAAGEAMLIGEVAPIVNLEHNQ